MSKNGMKKDKDSLHGRLGISQKLLADYLGIARSSITMAEKGHRSLPYKGMSRLEPLQGTTYNLDDFPPPASMEEFANKEAGMVKKHLENQVSICSTKLNKLKHQLPEFVEAYLLAMNALKLSGILLANLPDDGSADTQRQRVHLNMMESRAWKRITKCGQAVQTKMQMQIDTLTIELAAASEKLAGLG